MILWKVHYECNTFLPFHSIGDNVDIYGVDGKNGTNGIDTNSNCILCHSDDQTIVTKTSQGFLDDLVGAYCSLHRSSYWPASCLECHVPAGDNDEYLMMPGSFTTDLTAAHLNYNAIREDKSGGFHNPGYIEAVLENTIEALSAK